jgi:transposase-like protein
MHKRVRDRKIPKHAGRSGKAIVMGLLDRHAGKVRVRQVSDTKYKTLSAQIRTHVEPGSMVYSDENPSYRDIELDYQHRAVNHAAEEYVRENVHVNGIENFWSLLKRAIRGTYVSVEPFHLFRYLDEQAFRFNERKDEHGDRGRFNTLLSYVAGKRLTYKALIAQDEPSAAAPV